MNDIHDVWRQYGFSDDDNADEIIREVELNVLKMINLIIEEEPGILVQTGRKSAHLLSHYKINLDEERFLTCLFRGIGAELLEAKPEIPEGSTVIIVSDSIHTGKEMKNVIQNFNIEDIEIKKIFCYLLNHDGFLSILEEGLIEKEKTIYLFPSFSEEEYVRESNKLQVFYRNRIEPMDPDVCFNKYNVDEIINTDILLEILTPFNEYVEECDTTVEVSSDRGFSTKIEELLWTIDYCDFLDEILHETFLETFDCEINGISIRFKINKKTIDSDFTIIVKSEGTCNTKSNVNHTCCLDDKNMCMLTKFTYPNSKVDEAKSTICPRCLDLWFSSNILDFLDEHIHREFSNKGYECTLIRKYRPFE